MDYRKRKYYMIKTYTESSNIIDSGIKYLIPKCKIHYMKQGLSESIVEKKVSCLIKDCDLLIHLIQFIRDIFGIYIDYKEIKKPEKLRIRITGTVGMINGVIVESSINKEIYRKESNV